MMPADHGYLIGYILLSVVEALIITFILTKVVLSLISESLSDVLTFIIALVSVILFNIILFPGGGKIIEIIVFYIPLTITWLLFDLIKKRKADKANRSMAREWLTGWHGGDIKEPNSR